MGGSLILGGLYIVARFEHNPGTASLKSANLGGSPLAFSVTLLWTTGAMILKLGLTSINALFAGVRRTSSEAAALTSSQYGSHATTIVRYIKNRKLTKISLTSLSRMLGYGVSGIAHEDAIQRVGDGRTVLVTSLTRVFLLIISALFLKGKPMSQPVIRTSICVAGLTSLSAYGS